MIAGNTAGLTLSAASGQKFVGFGVPPWSTYSMHSYMNSNPSDIWADGGFMRNVCAIAWALDNEVPGAAAAWGRVTASELHDAGLLQNLATYPRYGFWPRSI